MRFRVKVTLALLIVGLVPLSTLALTLLQRQTADAEVAAETMVDAIGQMKSNSVSTFFSRQVLELSVLAASPGMQNAMGAFVEAADTLVALDTVAIDGDAMAAFYDRQFALTKGADTADRARWQDDLDKRATVLQQLFILQNPEQPGDKDKTVKVAGGGRYSMAHQVHHPYFREIEQTFGFYDVFLIEPQQGGIIYTTEKEADFGTSVLTGPYRDSGLAKAAAAMIADRGSVSARMTDFAPYEPSANAFAAFILVPVGTGENFKGILAVQISLDFMQAIASRNVMSNYDTVQSYVLGKAGQVVSAPPRGGDGKIGETLAGPLAQLAITGQLTDAAVTRNHLDEEVIAKADRLDLPGVEWLFITEVTRAEALALSDRAYDSSLIFMAVLSVLIILSGLAIGSWLLRPVLRLSAEMHETAGKANETLQVAAQKAGDAAQTMAAIADQTSRQAEIVRENSAQATGNLSGVAAAVSQISNSVSEVTTGIRETSNLVSDTAVKAIEAARLLDVLEQVADRIKDMVQLINDVANRTNLLALNAAVEAAHAGPAGRGFAVVASEIRKLAGQTTASTETIAAEVRAVFQAVEANAKAIRDISSAVTKVSGQASGIAVAATQQQQATEEISSRMAATANRVAEVDDNIATVRTASDQAARTAAMLLEELESVSLATARMGQAIDTMSLRISRL